MSHFLHANVRFGFDQSGRFYVYSISGCLKRLYCKIHIKLDKILYLQMIGTIS
ncbi:hypothetical protein DYU11_08690 [Fibrisoma montanum]|uniref:Notch NOD domain-containing protein n=1 Tax=Fibrisoma montanum TaxID=2305895 RepID=A0A418MFP2_9BACT|nr:hypothetical protein DYU11_08690 [Fibrisoma montanum]